jgi:ParB family transcriptional regulator, chromosome partitioning protein
MSKSAQKIALSASRDIPFDRLVLSQANVRRIKAGIAVEELAEDIARRTLLQSLTVRPVLTTTAARPAPSRCRRAVGAIVRSNCCETEAPRPHCADPLHDPHLGPRRGGQPGRERAARAAAPTLRLR